MLKKTGKWHDTFAQSDGTVGNELINYHVRRAKGGCAMNIVEIACVHPSTGGPGYLCIYDDKFIPGLTKLASAIKKAGSRACIQLWHAGRQTSGKPIKGGKPWAPSAIPCPLIKEVPHEMTIDEIKEVIASYGDAAARAKEAGFEAIEIHAAHGYLIDSFLNEYTNHRTDEYGGDFENRSRFGREVVETVRNRVGKNFPILLRMSAVENVKGGIVLEDGIKVGKLYEKAGVDCLDVSQGCYGAITYTVPPYFHPLKVNTFYAQKIKENVNIPVIVAGRINTPELAEEVLENNQADFISLGRVQLADPDFVKKTAEGRVDEIVRCIACDQGCVDRVFKGLGGASCVFNPAAGHEAEVQMIPTDHKKKVLVIGGGPAGLEAARVAKERGHDVVLFEKSSRLGGQFLLAGFAPDKSGFTDAAIHMGYRAHKAGVDVRINTEATADRIKVVNPDFVIIATGSKPIIPPIKGIDNPNVFEAREVISTKQKIATDNVVVIGGGLVGLEAMEILTKQGKKVSIVEMDAQVGKDTEIYIMPHLFKFLAQYQIPVYTNSKCLEIGKDYVLVEKDGKETTIPCETVILQVLKAIAV